MPPNWIYINILLMFKGIFSNSVFPMGKHLSMAWTIANYGKLRCKYVLNCCLLMPSYHHAKFLNDMSDGTLFTALCCFWPKIGVKWKTHIYATFTCLWLLIMMLNFKLYEAVEVKASNSSLRKRTLVRKITCPLHC